MFGFLFVCCVFLALLEKQNQWNAIMKTLFKICTGFEQYYNLPLQQILIKDLKIILFHINGQKWNQIGLK